MTPEGKEDKPTSIYAGMSWPGLIGYILDKHIINSTLLILIMLIPGGFLFLFYTAKSDSLQKELIAGSWAVLANLSITTYLGWVSSGLLLIGILVTRSTYKIEIHRLSEEKNSLLKRFGVTKASSGHDEKDMG